MRNIVCLSIFIQILAVFLRAREVVSQVSNSPSVSEVVELSNKLVPKLLQDNYERNKNFVVSPFGLVSNLAMIMEGVGEKSRQEIATALGLHQTRKDSWQSFRNGFALILKDFEDQKDNSDVSGTFNRAVIYSSLPLVPEYQKLLLKYYRANVTQIKQPKNVTEHMMEVSSDTGVISHWKDYKSLAVYTYLEQSQSSFSLPDGNSVEVPMVPILSPSAGYLPVVDSIAARIPLEDFSSDLFLIMPNTKENMNETLKKLTNKKLAPFLLSLPKKDYEVSIPQFSTISNDLDMTSFLKNLGIARIFRSGKENERPRGVYISKVSQNTYFGTSFIGLKSVASSNAVMRKQIITPRRQRREEATKIVFNKPFFYCVVHKYYGLILLTGVVTNPKQNP